jgi:hypothetical protein
MGRSRIRRIRARRGVVAIAIDVARRHPASVTFARASARAIVAFARRATRRDAPNASTDRVRERAAATRRPRVARASPRAIKRASRRIRARELIPDRARARRASSSRVARRAPARARRDESRWARAGAHRAKLQKILDVSNSCTRIQ